MKTWYGRKITDRTKEFWNKKSKQKLPEVMESIMDNWDEKTFNTEQTQFIKFVKNDIQEDFLVLDLACGIGRNCKWIAPHVGYYHGIDFIEGMIVKAKQYNRDIPNTLFKVNDGKTIPYDDRQFEMIFSELAFQHMTKDIQNLYVNEVYRTLRKGGIFIAQIPRMSFYNNDEYARTNDEILEMFDTFNELKFLEGHKAYFTVRAIK